MSIGAERIVKGDSLLTNDRTIVGERRAGIGNRGRSDGKRGRNASGRSVLSIGVVVSSCNGNENSSVDGLYKSSCLVSAFIGMRKLEIGQTFWIPASKVESLLPPRDMEIMQGRPEALQSLIVQLMPEMISKDGIRELRGLE